jgi:hypothetical protein
MIILASFTYEIGDLCKAASRHVVKWRPLLCLCSADNTCGTVDIVVNCLLCEA